MVAVAVLPEGETLRKRLDKRAAALQRELDPLLPTLKDLATYFMPNAGQWQENDGKKRGAKEKRNKIINSTGTYARRTCGAGLASGMAAEDRPWFRLETDNPDLNEYQPVKLWLYIVGTILRNVLSRSNFYTAISSVLNEISTFATGCMLALEDPEEVIRFYPCTIGSYLLGADAKGRVNALYRVLRMTVAQMIDEFGTENVTATVKNACERGDYDHTYLVRHVIEPNKNRDITKIDNRNMPYLSVWYELGQVGASSLMYSTMGASGYNTDPNNMLRITGFVENPIEAPRWETVGEDVYGSDCPGMIALGDVKGLQYLELQKAKAIDKEVDPPMVASPELRNQRSSILAGDVTFVAGNQSSVGFAPAYQVKPDRSGTEASIVAHETRIDRAFFADLFQAFLSSDRRQITAAEIAGKHDEKLQMLGPVPARLNRELLNACIDRIFGVCLRRGLIPQAPAELHGQTLKVVYVSLLVQAQQLMGIATLERFTGYVSSLVAVDQEAADKVSFDEMIDEYASMTGVSPKLLLSPDVVVQNRQARQQREMMQSAVASAAPVASAAKDLGSTPADPNSLLGKAGQMLAATQGAQR